MTVRRDSQGRFAKKVAPKKVAPKKVTPKKVEPKKVAPKKAPPKKVAPKKVVPKKAPPKKVEPKKVAPKKVVPKKVAPKKVAPKKVAPKKVAPKKVAPKKVTPKKVEPKKVAPKKVAPKKVAPKKVAPKKVAPKKVAPKKVAPKKVAPKKVAPKKAALKKVAPKKAAPRKAPSRKVRRRRRRVLPGIPERSRRAEAEILAKLADLMEIASLMVEGADVAVKSFINSDGSVDGELKIAELPDELRSEDGIAQLVAILSEIFRAFRPFPVTPSMGGRFWVSFALRFGPQNETEVGKLAELYKRFRGLYQVGTYPAAAWHPTPIQLALTTGLKTIVEGVSRKQGFPPSVILVRFTWTPDGKHPGHLKGEAGGGR